MLTAITVSLCRRAVGAALLGREAVIEGAEAVAKSYPAFFAEFIRLGGGADVL